jgi:hypothetical protein
VTVATISIRLEDDARTRPRADDAGPPRAEDEHMTTRTAVDDVLEALEGADGASLIPFIDLDDAEEVEALVAILTWREPLRESVAA